MLSYSNDLVSNSGNLLGSCSGTGCRVSGLGFRVSEFGLTIMKILFLLYKILHKSSSIFVISAPLVTSVSLPLGSGSTALPGDWLSGWF